MGSVAVGVDFGSQYVKFARLRRRGQNVVIERLVKIPHATTDTAEQIASGLKQAGLRAPGAIMGVSGRGAIIRYTMVPPVPANRLKMIMDYEIGELAGKSSEAVSSDYKILSIPREVSQDFTVMVAMSKDEYVRGTMFELESAGVHVADILPTPLALYNTFLGLGICEEGSTYLVVDIGATNTDVAIVNDRDLFFARSIGRGADDFTEVLSETLAVGFPEAERIKLTEGLIARSGWRTDREKQLSDALTGAAMRLHATLNSSVGFAGRQLKLKNIKIDKVVLLGGGSNLPGLPEHLARLFDVEVIAPDIHDILGEPRGFPGKVHLVDAVPAGDVSGISHGMREFSTAIGLALSQMDTSCYSMDLVPAEEKKKRVFKERTVFMYAAGAILLVFLIVRLVAAWSERGAVLARQEEVAQRLDESQQRLFALRAVTKENAQISSAIGHLSKITEQGNFMTRLLFLTRKQEVTPKEIEITDMELRNATSDEEGRTAPIEVLISGKVSSPTGNEHDLVSQFKDQLLKTDLVKLAQIDASRTGDVKGEFRFELSVYAGRTK